MANPEGVIEIGGKKYPVVFSTNALFQLDMYLKKQGLPRVSQFLERLQPQINKDKSVVRTAELDLAEMHLLLFAMLEGGRRRSGWRAVPFTVDEVGDMCEIGDLPRLFEDLIKVMAAAAPVKEGEEPKNAKAGSSIGKRSSRRR